MAQGRAGRACVATLVVLTASLGAGPAGAAQPAPSTAPDVAVFAAFLYNFAKFTEWPQLPAGAAIKACVVGNDPVAQALTAIVRGKDIAGHPINVAASTDRATWGDCQLLFVAGGYAPRAAADLAGIRRLPVLTASDAKGFSREGGIVEFSLEGGQMRFAVNLDAAERSGLRLSSRLLGLAKVVRDHDAA